MAQVKIKSLYKPNEKQREAHGVGALYTLYGGAWGGGKTRWLCEEVLQNMIEYNGIECLIGRFDYKDVMEPTQIWDQFRNKVLLDDIIKEEYRSAPAWIRLVNGSRVTFTGLKDYKAGAEYGIVAIDQAEEVPEGTIELLSGRLRQLLPNGKAPHYRMIMSCNPAPGYLKERFVLHPDENHVFVQALPEDNQEFLPPDYIPRQKASMSEEMFARYMQSNWDVFAGQAFPEWDRWVHEIEPHYLWRQYKWPVYLGVDHGITAPTVGEWVTVSPDGDIIFCMEYVREGEIPSNNAKAIKMMSVDLNIQGSWIDPRTAQVKADLARSAEWSVYNEYLVQGVYCQLAMGTRQNRLAAWKEGLRLRPERRHPTKLTQPAPEVYVMKCCDLLRTELPEMTLKGVNEGYWEDVVKQKDHAYDAGGFVLENLIGRKPSKPPIHTRQRSSWELL